MNLNKNLNDNINENIKTNKQAKIKNLALAGISFSLALVLTYLESFLPAIFPGIPFRWGLSNIVVMFALLRLGLSSAIVIAIAKAIFNLAWSPIAFSLSFSAGLVSVILMSILLRKTSLSINTISITSALTHNFIQIIIVFFFLPSFPLHLFIIPLLIISILSGFLSATLLGLCLKNIKFLSHNLLILFSITSILSLSSCKQTQIKEYTKTYLNFFDTISLISIYAEPKDEAKINEVFNEIENRLNIQNRLFDNFKPYEGVVNVYSINEFADKRAMVLDDDLYQLISLAKKLAYDTNMAFTPTVGSLSSIWQNDYKKATATNLLIDEIANSQTISEAMDTLDLSSLILDEKKHTIRFAKKGMKLDLGGIAKGYAAETVAKILKDNNFNSALINLGGNVKVLGQKRNHEQFRIGINNPYLRLAQTSRKDSEEYKIIEKNFPKYTVFVENPNNEAIKDFPSYLDYVNAADGSAVVSSGIYERFFFSHGKRYSHLIDTTIGISSNKYLGITVVNSDSTVSDALSTALYSLSVEDGKKLLDKIAKDSSVIWYNWDGKKDIYGENIFTISSQT